MDSLERYTTLPTWGAGHQPQEPSDAEEEIPIFMDEQAADVDTSSSSSSPSDGEEDKAPDDTEHEEYLQLATEMQVQWLAPRRSHLVHIARPGWLPTTQADATPLCRQSPFVAGFIDGQGVAVAADLQRSCCHRCLHKLPGLPKDASAMHTCTLPRCFVAGTSHV